MKSPRMQQLSNESFFTGFHPLLLFMSPTPRYNDMTDYHQKRQKIIPTEMALNLYNCKTKNKRKEVRTTDQSTQIY
mgnify:FL=1